MIKTIRELKRDFDRRMSLKSVERDEEGRAVIRMNVRDDSDFLSDYSMSDSPVISSGVAEFLEDRSSYLFPKEQLSLFVHSDCISEEEKILYRRAIAEYYEERYVSAQREYKKNIVSAIRMAILGVLFLALMIVFNYSWDSPIWTEVIDIVAWVFLWEATDLAMIENRLLSFKRMRYLALSMMKITFIDEKQENE